MSVGKCVRVSVCGFLGVCVWICMTVRLCEIDLHFSVSPKGGSSDREVLWKGAAELNYELMYCRGLVFVFFLIIISIILIFINCLDEAELVLEV